MVEEGPTVSFDGKKYPALVKDDQVCNAILNLASVTNGELAYRSYKNMEEKVGLPLVHLAQNNRGTRVSYKELQAKPMVEPLPLYAALLDVT